MTGEDKRKYKSPWICVGSGPTVVRGFSRALNEVGARAHIATCNGGYKICGIPQAYGLFENDAVSIYGKEAQQFAAMGKHIYMNNWGLSSLKLWENPNAKYIDCSYCVKRGAGRANDLGLMTSGVLMLMIIANEYKPKSIHVCGQDGFKPDSLHHPEIPLWEKMNDRPDSWCKAVNDGMSKYITMVTNMFKDIKFYWYGGKPLHADRKWKVTYVD